VGAIYGLMGWSDLEAARSIGDRLQHRGRYGAVWAPGRDVVLGARGHRLLVDLQEHGPVAFDGAIDNRRELAQWLGRRDASTVGPAEDAQLLFEVVSARGIHELARVGGVFAAALWLGSERRLLLVRDRLGFAPLYFAPLGGRAAFASETKGLLALADVPARLDRGALQVTIATGHLPVGASCLDRIHPVAPGTCLELRAGRMSATRFWDAPAGSDRGTEAEELARLRGSFLDAIRRQTAAYGRVGVGLSGGFHSALVAAGVRTVAGGREVHTYTAAYAPDDPSLLLGERIARELGTRHHPLIVPPRDLPALLPWIAWLLEGPAGAVELPLLFLAAREAAGTVDLFLTGSGHAELSGETESHRLACLARRYRRLRAPLGELYRLATAGELPRSVAGRLLHAVIGGGEPAPPPVFDAPPAEAVEPPTGSESGAVVREELLRRPPIPLAERLCAAAGTRLNAATTDPAFFTTACELADRAWRGPGGSCLRRAGARLLPRLGLERAPPGPSGFHPTELQAVLDDMAGELLSPQRVRARGIFPPEYVKAVTAPERGGRENPRRTRRLWSLLLTEAWCQSHLDRRGAAPAGRMPTARPLDGPGAGAPRR
jgi:asparagine synthase (glutamine-hydrolysing)